MATLAEFEFRFAETINEIVQPFTAWTVCDNTNSDLVNGLPKVRIGDRRIEQGNFQIREKATGKIWPNTKTYYKTPAPDSYFGTKTGKTLIDYYPISDFGTGTTGEATYNEAFSTVLTFSNVLGHYRQSHTQTGAVAFTVDVSGNKAGSVIVQPFISDGVNPVNLNFGYRSDFTSGDILAAGNYDIYFNYEPNTVRVHFDLVGTVVAPPANVAPVANAGADQNLTAGTTTATLTGSGTDSDGTIASYAWTKISGAGTITTPNAASTGVTGLVDGASSVFRLIVTDNNGLVSAPDDVSIIVAAAGGNTTPVAPTFSFNTSTRILTISHALGDSEILYNEADGAYVQYVGSFQTDDFAKPEGYYKAKTKAATGRNESLPANSPQIFAYGSTSIDSINFRTRTGITDITAAELQGSGTGEGLTTGLLNCGTGVDWKVLEPNTDGQITFRHQAADSGNFNLGLSKQEKEDDMFAIMVGVHVNNSNQILTINNGVIATTAEAIAISVGEYIRFRRVAGVWTLQKSPDGLAYGPVLYTYAFAENVNLYPLINLVGKIYEPRHTGLTDIPHSPPIYLTTRYKTANISEVNNGIYKSGSNDNYNAFYTSLETFQSRDCIRFTLGDATHKNLGIGFSTETNPTSNTQNLFTVSPDHVGNLNFNIGGTANNRGTYNPGDMLEVYGNGNIKKSSDGGVTWVLLIVDNVDIDTAGVPVYGFAYIWSNETHANNIQKR